MKFSQKLPKEQKPAAFHALMAEIAAELGGYRYTSTTPEDEYCYQVTGLLDHPAKNIALHVRLNIDGYHATGKIDVSGIYARGPKGETLSGPRQLTAPSMSCSPERPVRTIAGDIQRRMIAPYIPYAAAVQEIADSMKARQDKLDATRKQLQELGYEFYNGHEFKGYNQASAWKTTATIYSEERVDLELRGLNPYLIREILHTLETAAAV